MKNNKFKEGMWMVCLPGFNGDGSWRNKNSGGAGWKEDKIVQIERFSEQQEDERRIIAWPISGSGIFCQALRPATEWEIEHKQIQKDTLYEIY